jgi:hypothetical protein
VTHRQDWLASGGKRATLTFGGNLEEDKLTMLENGFISPGFSNFEGPRGIDPNLALDFSRSLYGVQQVVFYQRNAGSIQTEKVSAIPTISNGTVNAFNRNGLSTTPFLQHSSASMQFVPTTITEERVEYAALYWVKTHPRILGAYVDPLTDLQRQELESNKGVSVRAVVKGSPAFKNDILRGDIIRRINGIEVVDPQGFSETLGKLAGTNVKIDLLRKSKMKSIRLKLDRDAYLSDQSKSKIDSLRLDENSESTSE